MENLTNQLNQQYTGSILWIIINCAIICGTLAGNLLTIIAIIKSRQLSSLISNQLIFSLAVSDLLVGISIPYHMCFYLIKLFGETKLLCLIRFVFILFACSSSIINLFFISTDRYISIVYPLYYVRYITRKKLITLIIIGWLISLILSTVPFYWNKWDDYNEYEKHRQCNIIKCEPEYILPANYFYFVLIPMFIHVWLTMFIVYVKIWKEVNEHTKRLRIIYSNTSNVHCSLINSRKSIQNIICGTTTTGNIQY